VKYFDQGYDQCCFVYAVANCAIYLKIELKDVEKAKDIADCRRDPCGDAEIIVSYFGVPLKKTEDYFDVLEHGGIFTFRHPIHGAHSCFIYPDGHRTVALINSFLGPLVTKKIAWRELTQFMDYLSCRVYRQWTLK